MGKFPEPRARFYSAEITLALEHIHKLDIVYRCVRAYVGYLSRSVGVLASERTQMRLSPWLSFPIVAG